MCRYRPTDTTEWRTVKIASRRLTEATVSNLTPGQEYEFMVLSQDRHGDGMFSKAVRIFTDASKLDYTFVIIIIYCITNYYMYIFFFFADTQNSNAVIEFRNEGKCQTIF